MVFLNSSTFFKSRVGGRLDIKKKMWRWRNCFILILPGVVSGLVVADRKGSVGKFLALLEELNGGVGQDNSRLPYSSADSPSAVRLRQQVLGLTEKILTLGGSPWEEAAALEAAQSGGSGAKLLKKGDGPLNQGHVPGMEDYAPDPPMHDAGCEGALPVSCDPAVPFRTITGLCNNLFHPLWGSASSRLARFVPPVYADGMGSPRGSYRPTICDRAEVGEECPRCFTDPKAQLPNARLVSRMIHPSVNIADRRVTHMVAQFGQFVDHDIALSPEMELEEGEGDCCNPLVDDPGCFPILVPEGDRFIPVDCLDFKRSVVFCQKTYEVREQMNAITAFVDASNVYGSSVDVSLELRETEGGLLRVLDGDGGGGGDLLPMIGDDPAAGGDVRAREQPGLTSMHALFVREHNRVARLVGMANQDLGDEEIYQHTRRIVGAQMQNIVYSHWLPVVLGQLTVRELGLAPDYLRDYYDPKLDPSIRNGFSTAAFRFGHSMIQGMLELFSVDSLRKVSNFQLRENFFDPSVYFDHMEEIIAGLFQQNAQRMDMFVTEDLSNFLFQNLDPNGIGMDLVARNIQRGRDHGLPGTYYTTTYVHSN